MHISTPTAIFFTAAFLFQSTVLFVYTLLGVFNALLPCSPSSFISFRNHSPGVCTCPPAEETLPAAMNFAPRIVVNRGGAREEPRPEESSIAAPEQDENVPEQTATTTMTTTLPPLERETVTRVVLSTKTIPPSSRERSTVFLTTWIAASSTDAA